MNDTRVRIASLLMTAVLVAGWGCGSGAPPEDSSTEEATVSGTVKFKGKLLTKGEVTFSPGNTSRPTPPRKSEIGKDGTYSVKTYVGENDVEVFSTVIQKAGPDIRPFSYQVQSGENTLDIELPMP